jgi:hypothetical protein
MMIMSPTLSSLIEIVGSRSSRSAMFIPPAGRWPPAPDLVRRPVPGPAPEQVGLLSLVPDRYRHLALPAGRTSRRPPMPPIIIWKRRTTVSGLSVIVNGFFV